LQEFVHIQRLPETFVAHAQQWFVPLAARLAAHHRAADRPIVIGVNGSQGSGKSTLSALLSVVLAREYSLHSIDLSIDDFYLTRAQRQALAKTVHPLLATRGVPGTHDVDLLADTLQRLRGAGAPVAVPRFDKSQDDRVPSAQWQSVDPPLDIIILEGWCLGVRAQQPAQLATPANALERDEDKQGTWREYVNARLQEDYHRLYDLIDIWVMLQAPSFDSVFRWRLEQEQKLAQKQTGTDSRVMSAEQIARFIQHYQRLTQQALDTLPATVHYLFRLDEQRRILEATQPRAVSLA
jgi:D-glycerate 3-kinase